MKILNYIGYGLGKFFYGFRHPILSVRALMEENSKLFKNDEKFEMLSNLENNDYYEDDYTGNYTNTSGKSGKKESKKKLFKNPFKGTFKNRGKLFSDDSDYDEFYNMFMTQKKERELKEEINSVDFENVDVLDYISLYLSDIDISNESLLNLQKEIEKLLDNPNKGKEFRKKLKEIKDVMSNEKYDRLHEVINRINTIYDDQESIEIENEKDSSKNCHEQIESDIIEEKSNSEKVSELEDIIFDYLSDVKLDNVDSMKLYKNIILIVNKGKENELKKFIVNHSSIDNELRYDLIINEMLNIIDGKLEEDDTKDKKVSNNDVSDLLESLQAAEKSASQSLGSCDEEIERIKANLNKEDIENVKDSSRIEPIDNSHEQVIDSCNKIDEKNPEKYDKKCEKEYKLYHERMTQILKLNDMIIELKSKIREYELKLENEKKKYVKYWGNALFEQEKQQSLKEQSNCEMLESFTDEELRLMKENGFDNNSDIKAVIEFKKIMKM